jgi:hypothetical protein
MSIYLVHTARVQALVPQLVRCVHCDTEYVYEMKRVGRGTAESDLFFGKESARKTAEETARQLLAAKLQDPEACDPVPCPACFLFQPYMRTVSAYKKYGQALAFLGTMIFLGGAVLATAIALLLFGPGEEDVYWFGGGGLCILLPSVGFLRFTYWLIAKHDPNNLPIEKREDLAAKRAIPRALFEDKQRIRVQEAYTKYASQLKRGRARAIELWLVPSAFLNGSTISFELSETEEIELVVPPETEPGTVLTTRGTRGFPPPVEVRVLAIRVHPDEMRLE